MSYLALVVLAGVLTCAAAVWCIGLSLDAALGTRQRALFAAVCFAAGFCTCAVNLALRA